MNKNTRTRTGHEGWPDPVFTIDLGTDNPAELEIIVEKLIKKRDEALADMGIDLEECRRRREWDERMKSGGIGLAEGMSFSEYLSTKTGKYFMDHDNSSVLHLYHVLRILSEGISKCGFEITKDQIRDYFFRHGYLTEEPNKVLYLGQTHTSGNTFFSNIRRFGAPNGTPVVLLSKRAELTEHLTDLFLELFVTHDTDDHGITRIQMERSGSFFVIISPSVDNRCRNYRFVFSDNNHHYDLTGMDYENVIGFLQKELRSKELGLCALLHNYLGDRINLLRDSEQSLMQLIRISDFHELS